MIGYSKELPLAFAFLPLQTGWFVWVVVLSDKVLQTRSGGEPIPLVLGQAMMTG